LLISRGKIHFAQANAVLPEVVLQEKKRAEMAKLPEQLNRDLDTRRNRDQVQPPGPERTRWCIEVFGT